MKRIAMERARGAARRLVKEHGCLMMKIATEDEGLTQADVAERVRAYGRILTIELKTGGPGARGDLVHARRLGLRHFIAPMIESAYGLEDYLAGVAEVFAGSKTAPHLGINVETEGAAERVEEILEADSGRRLAQVTVGRGDLSKSMGRSPDDPAVMRLSGKVLKAARARGYETSVGGGLDPRNIRAILERLKPDMVNTRNFAFAAGRADRLSAAVRAALEAEILVCAATRGELAKRRIPALKSRLASL